MTPRDVLVKARALLVERGWYQGWFVDERGKCLCSVGACWVALGVEFTDNGYGSLSLPEERPEFPTEAMDALKAQVPEGHFIWWQDHRGRTVDEVLAAFDRAIASLEPTP